LHVAAEGQKSCACTMAYMSCTFDFSHFAPVLWRCRAPALGAATLLLAGCAGMALPGRGVPALAVPLAWSSSAAAVLPAEAPAYRADPAALAQWWQRFGDPQL